MTDGNGFDMILHFLEYSVYFQWFQLLLFETREYYIQVPDLI